MQRSSGILLHITSLPSPYGIGTLGAAAFAFVDFLRAAGVRYWQILPLGATTAEDSHSPYQTRSAFAGNPLLIDLDELVRNGLLEADELACCDFGADAQAVDFHKVEHSRNMLFEKAFSRFVPNGEYQRFVVENQTWLRDYALFSALRGYFGGRAWSEWPEPAKRRELGALEHYAAKLHMQIEFECFLQFEFFKQYHALREYANNNGVLIYGDLPIYLPYDSADVWAQPALFLLDENLNPTEVAGVPPDYFSKTGQLWGSPIYDWALHERRGFEWWIGRMRAAGALFDLVRIDHFRGLASYWSVPYGERDAVNGRWNPGPRMALVGALQRALPAVEIVAEDLGHLTQDVYELLDASGLPGMRVLQFCFDGTDAARIAHEGFFENVVVYTGTHDNTTVRDWLETAGNDSRATAVWALGLNEAEGYVRGFIRAGMASKAKLVVAQMQDYLALSGAARMNIPSTVGGNWIWRMLPGAATERLAREIAELAGQYGRHASHIE